MSGTYGDPQFDDVTITGLGSVKTILSGLADVVSTADNQVLQIAQETATAVALGTPADAQWSGTGSGSTVALLKAIYVATVTGSAGDASAANQSTQITAANATNATLGGIGDNGWSGTGNGSVNSVLKAISLSLSAGTIAVSDSTSHTSLATIVTQSTAINTVTGTQADTAWSGTGNGTLNAILKAISIKLSSSTLLTSDATSHTSLAAIQTAVTGTLTVSDSVSHTSLAAIATSVAGTLATSDAATHTTLGGVADAAWTTGSGSTIALLKAIAGVSIGTQNVSDATTHTSLATLVTAVGAQGVAAPAGILRMGGIYNTTLPTLTSGQSSGLQLDVNGRLILANGSFGIVTISSGTAANSLAVPIHVDLAQAGAALSATNGIFTNIVQAGAVVSTGNALFVQDVPTHTSLASILTQDTATATATGTTADAAWTTGNGTIISLLKTIASGSGGGAATAANQTSQITQETAIATGVGTVADTAWVSGSGSLIAVTKADATSNIAISSATGTQADTAWTTGSGSVVALLKAIAAVTIGTSNVSDATTHTSLATLVTAATTQAGTPATGMLSVGGIFNTTAPVLTTGQASKLQVDTNGSVYVNIRAQAGSLLNVSDATSHTSLATIAAAFQAKATLGATTNILGIGLETQTSLPTFANTSTNMAISDVNGRMYVTDDQSHTSLTAMAASLVTINTADTATAAATGTTADTTWTGTGSGSVIAILKKIATGSTGAVTTQADQVQGVAATTGLFAVGGVYNTTPPTLTTGLASALQLNGNGYLRTNDVLMDNAVASQGAAPPAANIIMTGAIYNSTLPTLTTGQASRLQVDASSRLILGTSAAVIGSVTLAAGAASIGTVILGAGAAAVGSVTVSSSALPTGASTSAIQATQQTSLTAIAAAEGTTADTTWTGTGAGSAIAIQKAIATSLLGTINTSDSVTRAALGTPADTAWVSGSGTMIALLKTIASGTGGGGGGTVNQGTAGASAWLVSDTILETAAGTPADTAWTTGSGSTIALLKAIAAVAIGTSAVSDATTHTTLTTINTTLGGTLTVSDNTTHTSLSSIVTADNATAAAMGTTADTAWVSGSGTMIALLKKIASGGGSAVTTGADNIQGAAAGTGLFSVGGVFLTTPPTLTNGQAGHLQLTANGYVMTADQGVAPSLTTQGGTPGTGMQLGGGIFNTTPPTLTTGQAGRLQLDSTGGLILGTSSKTIGVLAAGANLIGAVNVDMGGTAVSATAPLAIKEFKGLGAMTATPSGSTNGTAIGTLPGGSNGVRIYLKPSDSLTFTVATTAPSSAPAATMVITGNLTGPNWDEPLASGAMLYITVKVGTPMFRFI